MLYQTIQWYHQQHPEIKLGVVARSKSYAHLGVVEHLHLPFPYADFWLASPWYCLSLMVRSSLFVGLGLPVLRKREADFIAFVQRFDCLHFTGGGNIYSHHAPWLYYVFFLLFLSKRLGKKIWLTSQTIGPFNWFDRWLANVFLRLSDVIVLRGQSKPLPWKTFVGLDAAYDLPLLSTPVFPKKSAKTLRIGLSVHEWQNFGPKLSQVVVAALTELSKTQAIELVVLPHVFTHDVGTWDPGYMAAITRQLPVAIKITTVSAQEILRAAEPTVFVKTSTAELDLLIATRYHGLVFALSSNVPVMTFGLDDYYVEKNTQLLAMVYKDDWERYVVDLQVSDAPEQLYKIITSLHHNLAVEKLLLKENNFKLRNETDFFQLSTLVETLEH